MNALSFLPPSQSLLRGCFYFGLKSVDRIDLPTEKKPPSGKAWRRRSLLNSKNFIIMLIKSKLRLLAYRLRVRARLSFSWDTFLYLLQVALKIFGWWITHHPL
jgi:hypothetical protein